MRYVTRFCREKGLEGAAWAEVVDLLGDNFRVIGTVLKEVTNMRDLDRIGKVIGRVPLAAVHRSFQSIDLDHLRTNEYFADADTLLEHSGHVHAKKTNQLCADYGMAEPAARPRA